MTNGIKHQQAYFSLNKDKRTHLIYLGVGRLDQAMKMSENYKKLLEIVEEMTILNMALLKNVELDWEMRGFQKSIGFRQCNIKARFHRADLIVKGHERTISKLVQPI